MKEHRGISRAIKLINSILDCSLILLLLLGLAYGCYALWDSQNLAQEATAEQYAIYKPQEDSLGFEELRALNEDVLGWITVYGTPIDYPVVQGEDNWEYINKSAEGTYSLTGAIFMDASCDSDFQDFNTILYGHNMVPNVMFGSIKEFKERSFFDSHPYGNLYIQNHNYGLEIFGLIEADAYDSSIFQTGVNGAGRQSYLTAIRDHGVYLRDLALTDDDRIVLLSTCSSESTNGRDILVARLTDQVYEDTFAAEKEALPDYGSADRLKGLRDLMPQWKTALFLLLIILIVICLVDQWFCRRRRRRRK